MEDYVKEAPEKVSPSHRMQRRKDEAQKSEENGKQVGNKAMVAAQQKPAVVVSEADLLGLNEPSPRATQSEESNSLALAICQTSNEQAETNHANTSGSGWELALVTTPSTTNSPQTKAGGFDKMLLDSLYEDDISRRQLQLQRAGYGPDGYGYGASPFEQPFSIASSPADARMVMMSPQQRYQMMMMQQQQQQQQQHNMMMMMMASHNQNHPYASPYHQQQQQQQQQQIVSMNPFGDPFSYSQSSMPPHPNRTLF